MKACDLSYDQMRQMQNHVVSALIQYARDNGISGLSHGGWFSYYDAIDEAISAEWKKTQNVPKGAI